MPECYHCHRNLAMPGDTLCKECADKVRPIKEKDYRSFQIFFEEYIKSKSEIEGLLVADDALLQYEYYKMDHRFVPLLGGGLLSYREEHAPLKEFFLNTFFSLFRERIYSLDGQKIYQKQLEDLKKDFFDFYRSVNPYLSDLDQSISDSGSFYFGTARTHQTQLILKKGMITRGIDPHPIDIVVKQFDPGSALFYLELFVLLKNKDILKTFQDGLIQDSKDYRTIVRTPIVLLKPWEHQQIAFDAWNKGGKRGILEMATATGKTLVGIMAIEALYRTKPDGVVRIFAHSTNILNQWRREVIEKLGIISNLNAPYTVPININGFSIHFNTLQMVYKNPSHYPADLLIADEVHHLAAFEYRKALSILCKWKMGLSATVEGEQRQKILTSELGKILYQFTLTEALEKGIVPSFRWIVCPVHLSIKEEEEFSEVTENIRKLFLMIKRDFITLRKITHGEIPELEDIGDFVRVVEIARYNKIDLPQDWKNLMGLILRRRWIIHRSHPRLQESIKLAKEMAKNHKVILFAMDIESCEFIAESLKNDVNNLFLVHSKVKTDVFSLIRSFRQGENGLLIGARMLDEGIDIPDASIGINVASSKTRLQLIQRLGRVLRKQKGKKSPVFFHYVAIPDKKNLLEMEDSLQFLDDLAWIQDTAMKMGMDTEVRYSDEILQTIAAEAETAISRKYSRKREKRVPKIGSLNVEYIINQFSPDAIERIIGYLANFEIDHQITDTEWTTIVKTAHQKKKTDTLQLPGYWWLLILAERNPRKLISLVCPDSDPDNIPKLKLPEEAIESFIQHVIDSSELFNDSSKSLLVGIEGDKPENELDKIEASIGQPMPPESGVADAIQPCELPITIEPESEAECSNNTEFGTVNEVIETPFIQPISEEQIILEPTHTDITSIIPKSAEVAELPEQVERLTEETILLAKNKITELFTSKQYSQTLIICENLLEKYPNNLYLLNMKAGCDYSLGNYADAGRCIQQAILLDPKKPLLWKNLSKIYIKLGNKVKAKKCLDRANNLNLDDI